MSFSTHTYTYIHKQKLVWNRWQAKHQIRHHVLCVTSSIIRHIRCFRGVKSWIKHFRAQTASRSLSSNNYLGLQMGYRGKGIALLWVVNATPQPLNPRERPGIHWRLGNPQKAGLEGCGKSHPPPGFDSECYDNQGNMQLNVHCEKIFKNALIQ